jgi:photosystem II stability/assembly factor-like uncharacterized protein
MIMISRSRHLCLAWCTLGLLLLAGCGHGVGAAASTASATPGHDYGATATPYGERAVPPTPTLTPPPGWSAILSGLDFTNDSTQDALVASAAQPGRIIGCGTRTPMYDPTPPHFVLSNDGGQTWQSRTIPNLPASQWCGVLADTLQPDTFAVAGDFGGSLYVTRDAGVTWTTLDLPRGWSTSGQPVLTRPIGLIGGQLVAVENRAYGSPGSLVHASLTTGSWHTIATTLPPAGADPYAAALDPDNPAVMYLSGAPGSTCSQICRAAVYRTTDGGASWQLAHMLPSAEHIALYTAHHQQVFAEELDGLGSPQPPAYSADGGTTWQDIPIGVGDPLWVSPQGRAYTESVADAATLTDTLYRLDPAHGTSMPIGTYTLGPGPVLATVVDGPAPAVLYPTPDQYWRLPLST